MIGAISNNVSALNAIATSQQVSANNVANMNTHGFKSSRTDLETGADGQGVNVAAIRKDESQGPQTPDTQTGSYIEGSNTDLAREMVTQMTNQTAYSANVTAIRTQDQMAGTLLNMAV